MDQDPETGNLKTGTAKTRNPQKPRPLPGTLKTGTPKNVTL